MASIPEPLLVILAPPPPFLLVPGKPSMPWPRWLRSFKKYIQALDEDKLSDSSKCELLQNCLGTEGQHVLTALIPKESTFSAVVSALTTYFSSKHTLQSCCLHFRHMSQKPGESVSHFVAALKNQLDLCSSEHLQSLLILDQLMEKTNCPQLRQRLLLDRDTLTLEQALVISKEFESASNESHLLDVHEISVNVPDDSDPPVQKKAKRGRPCHGEERAEQQTDQQTNIPARPHQFRDDYFYTHDMQYFSDEDSQPNTINTKNCDPAREAVIDSGTMTASPGNTESENSWIAAIDDAELDECPEDNEEEDEGLEPSSTALQEGFCEICGKDFRNVSWLARHMRTHTKEKPFSCPQCNLTFSQSYHMTRHMRNQHGAACYVCPVCGDSFASNSELHRHKKSHTSQVLSHPLSDEEPQKTNQLKSHMVPHGQDNIVLAEGLTSAQSNEVDHQEIFSSDTGDCENEVSNISDLESHAIPAVRECPDRSCETSVPADGDTSQDGGAPKPKVPSRGKINHSCPICVGRHFRSASKLARHMTTHTKERAFSCPQCSLTFSQSYHMTRHMRNQHGAACYVCPVCGDSFGSNSELHRHKKSHTSQVPSCPLSDKESRKRNQLKSHVVPHGPDNIVLAEDLTSVQSNEVDHQEISNSNTGECENEGGNISDLESHAIPAVPDRGCETSVPADGDTSQDGGAPKTKVPSRGKINHSCPICVGRHFRSASKLARHMTTHTKERAFSCPVCALTFTQSYIMKQHVREKHRQGQYNCPKCPKSFSSWLELRAHRKTHSVKCQDCGKIFGQMYHLKRHIASHYKQSSEEGNTSHVTLAEDLSKHLEGHTKKDNGICPKCNATFANLKDLETHMRVHGNSYSCKTCGKTFKVEYAYRKHEKAHHNKQSYHCSVCHKYFLKLSNYTSHIKIHSTRESKCPHCKVIFPTAISLKYHLRTHVEERPHQCNCCIETFEDKNELERHCLKHRKFKKERPYSCTRCDCVFSTLGELRKHMSSHTGEEPMSCSICGKTFLNKNKLEKHQLLHSGKRPHLCTVCGSSFSSAANLRLHSTIHTGEKLYKCPKCDKTYRTPSGLRLHSRQHMDVRPSYKCHECGRTYGRLTELKIHQRYHTGDRPYVCTCCNKRFVKKDKLKVHMRVHTGERPYKCVYCEQTFTQSGDRNRHVAKIHSDAVGSHGQ